MYTTRTALGRSVRIDDWLGFQGDVVLKMLYDYYSALTSIQEGKYFPLNLASIVNGTTLDLDGALAVCRDLAGRGLVTYNDQSHDLWLTTEGMQLVSDALARQAG